MNRKENIKKIYDQFLHRNPKEKELEYYMKYLYSFDKIKKFILNSVEYQNLNKKEIEINHYEDRYINNENIDNIDLTRKTEFGLSNEIKKKLDSIKSQIKKPLILTVSRNLYPPNGGGENWMLDCCQYSSDEYDNIGICFDRNRDYQYTKLNFLHLLEINFDIENLFLIIKYFNPEYIHNQDSLRSTLTEFCWILGIKFLTGFCFWNDIINLKTDYFNIDMENSKLEKAETFEKIYDYSHCYAASKFVNDIIYKVQEKKLNILESVSHPDFYFTPKDKQEYVSLLNCHFLKGGQELIYLLDNLDINIPVLGVITEKFLGFEEKVIQAFERRNAKNNINLCYNEKLLDVKEIYKVSEIVIVPSLVDETYCRVAYESMMNNIKTISYNNGNLKYLLKDYHKNIFIENPLKNRGDKDIYLKDDEMRIWKEKVEEHYYAKFKDSDKKPYEDSDQIKKEYLYLLKNSFLKNYKRETIGILCPFADQGLGIQSREYYSFLEKEGYEVAVFSFQPYFAKQIDEREWNYKNIYYSKNSREDIKFWEVIHFCFTYKVKKMIIPEVCFDSIFNIIYWFKSAEVEIICPINIETLRYNELERYWLIDKIVANNKSSHQILQRILPDRDIKFLDFNNYYMKKKNKEFKGEKIKLITCGGLNSFFRKNIREIYKIFNKLESRYDFHLTIMIQDEKINELRQTEKIEILVKNMSYGSVINKIKEHDIFIHLGDHEGLGLGFYEALNNNLPLVTLDTYPNKEFIREGRNGFLVKCRYEELTDNDAGVVRRAVLDLEDFENVITKILDNNFKDELIKIINRDKWVKNNYENNFIEILK